MCSTLSIIHHSHAAGTGTTWVQYLSQGHLGMWTGTDWDRTDRLSTLTWSWSEATFTLITLITHSFGFYTASVSIFTSTHTQTGVSEPLKLRFFGEKTRFSSSGALAQSPTWASWLVLISRDFITTSECKNGKNTSLTKVSWKKRVTACVITSAPPPPPAPTHAEEKQGRLIPTHTASWQCPWASHQLCSLLSESIQSLYNTTWQVENIISEMFSNGLKANSEISHGHKYSDTLLYHLNFNSGVFFFLECAEINWLDMIWTDTQLRQASSCPRGQRTSEPTAGHEVEGAPCWAQRQDGVQAQIWGRPQKRFLLYWSFQENSGLNDS